MSYILYLVSLADRVTISLLLRGNAHTLPPDQFRSFASLVALSDTFLWISMNKCFIIAYRYRLINKYVLIIIFKQ
jgi:hypothetical protein